MHDPDSSSRKGVSNLEGVQGALLAPGGQKVVPGQVLLLLAHSDQQVHGRPAGLGGRELGQRAHQLGQELLSCVLKSHGAVAGLLPKLTMPALLHAQAALRACLLRCLWIQCL